MQTLRIAAASIALLLIGGGALLWARTAREAAEAVPVATASLIPPPAIAPEVELPIVAPPAPSPRTKEEQRFARADRDDDGVITKAEYLHQRRRNFDKLDTNGDGRLSFEEYAVEGIRKFQAADANADGRLDAAEYKTTAPKPRKTATARAPAPPCECS